jgi:phosphoribosyl 1,2-cyclic phosphate phosphodiesterase
MKFKYLGTAAFEAVPALFCECETCKRIRQIGGKSIRTRSQAIVDNCLLIDFPADTVAHILSNNIDMSNVRHCLITHNHSDHLYSKDIITLQDGFSHMSDDYTLTFYATDIAGKNIETEISSVEKAAFKKVHPFDVVDVGEYSVTVLPAVHDEKSGPVIYQINDGAKTILYAHDTHFLHDDVWSYWQQTNPHFDLVSLDCTNALKPLNYIGHMGLAENIEVRKRMLEMGIVDEKTIFLCNHFSHNGYSVVYEEFEPIAKKQGFLTSYDGMEFEL